MFLEIPQCHDDVGEELRTKTNASLRDGLVEDCFIVDYEFVKTLRKTYTIILPLLVLTSSDTINCTKFH